MDPLYPREPILIKATPITNFVPTGVSTANWPARIDSMFYPDAR
jgi:hypothetical protein